VEGFTYVRGTWAGARSGPRGVAGVSSAQADAARLREAHLLFIGDVMMGRHVSDLIGRGNGDAPFENARAFLTAPDVTIANLESPMVPSSEFKLPPRNHTTFNLTADARLAPALTRAGIDIVSLANNHAFDAGDVGLQATARQVRAAGLVAIGLTTGVAQEAHIRDAKGIKIAFLAYTDFLNLPGTGVSYIRQDVAADRALVTSEIELARCAADVVVVFWHWGPEYAVQPSTVQKSLAQLSADAGADLVVGAHSHVAQGMELKGSSLRPAVVAYSLGNALFDQSFSLDVRQGLALDVRVDKRGVRSARLIPIENRRAASGYTINVVDDNSGQTALARAAKSTPDGLQWRTLWSAQQAQPALAIAYRRTTGARSESLEDLGKGPNTRVVRHNAGLTFSEPAIPGAIGPPQSGASAGGWQTLWSTQPDWQVTGYATGDVNSDGQSDLVYTLWKRELTWSRPPEGGMAVRMQGGDILPHIYVNTWARGTLTPLWHGSPRPAPLLSVAVAPIAGDGKTVLAALESAEQHIEKAPGTLRLWQWSGSFGFELLTTVKGSYSQAWTDGKVLLFR
jgi:poly-gamma-glutamate synthesis protein (capsule biosynthesis protein)